MLCFGRVPIVLIMSKPFWSGPNYFGQVQIRLFWTIFYDLDLSKMIWIRPKRIGPVQNDWYSIKNIWTIQNHFGLIKTQGIKMSRNVQKCPKMSKNVQKCPEMSKNVQKCPEMSRNVQKCPEMSRNVHEMSRNVKKILEMSRNQACGLRCLFESIQL